MSGPYLLTAVGIVWQFIVSMEIRMLLCLIQNLLSDVPLLSSALVPLEDLSSKTCSLYVLLKLFISAKR